MHGYVGKSMSVNARKAYRKGQKPKSRWTRADMLSQVANHLARAGRDIPADLFTMTKTALFERFFKKDMKHHVSVCFNYVYFYKLDEVAVDEYASGFDRATEKEDAPFPTPRETASVAEARPCVSASIPDHAKPYRAAPVPKGTPPWTAKRKRQLVNLFKRRYGFAYDTMLAFNAMFPESCTHFLTGAKETHTRAYLACNKGPIVGGNDFACKKLGSAVLAEFERRVSKEGGKALSTPARATVA